MNDIIERIIAVGALDPMPLANQMLKLTEEVGELAEAINHHQGYSPHKQMKEPPVGEVADVINSAIGVLAHTYPDMTHEQLLTFLAEHLTLKTNKWEAVLCNEAYRTRE